MSSSDSPSFLEICNALRVKRGYDFEVICNDYLKARYPGLVPWISTNVESTIPGTPDAFSLDESGHLIACQYGSSPQEWRSKLLGNTRETGDAEKVATLARRHGLTVRLLIFCTTAEIDLVNLKAVQNEVETLYGFKTEVCDLRRLSSDIENFYPGIAARRLGIPIHLQHFITIDNYIESTNQRYWPKQKDLDEDKLFIPLDYLKEIEAKLRGERRCLLTGRSGSGKTALAVTYGLWWRGDLKDGDKHPEAFVFYLDASFNYKDETGKDWYRQVLAHDYQNALYIIDNCHLSPAAVTAFCFQWRRRRPRHSAVIIISTPKVLESPWEDLPEDYFEYFEESEATIEIQPESFYKGILKKYSDIYRKNGADRFVEVGIDFCDETRAQRLENLCSHNLIAARGLLEAWGEVGGHLSNVGQDEVLDILSRRHLVRSKASALGPLCSLASFEISIQNTFIDNLPQESVEILLRENLLIPDDQLVYGNGYRIAFHPQVAIQLFKAYIRQKTGSYYEDGFDEEFFHYLKSYLLSGARNFQEVFRRLYQSGSVSLQHMLLEDIEVQHAIKSQFNTILLREVLWYLYILHLRDAELAKSMLNDFYGGADFQAKLLALPTQQFPSVAGLLLRIDANLARVALGDIPADVVITHLRSSNIRLDSIYQWISPASTGLAVQIGCSPAWRKQVAESLDPDLLADVSKSTSIHEFMWFLDSLIDVAPTKAQCLVDKLSPETLGLMLRGKNVKVVVNIVNLLLRLNFSSDFFSRLGRALDVQDLVLQIPKKRPSRIYWSVKTLSVAIPELALQVEAHLDPQEIVNSFSVSGDIQEFDSLWSATSARFMQQVLNLMDDELAATIFRRSSLGRIAAVLEYRIFWLKPFYLSFADTYLSQKLQEADLINMSKFIRRLGRVPEVGHDLAIHAIEILLQVNLRDRIAQTDLIRFALLCSAVTSVEPDYKERLLQTISPEDLRAAFKHSGISGIQSIAYFLRDSGSALLQTLKESLQRADLTQQIEQATIEDLAYLLWNIRAAFGAELAQEYCRLVDDKLTPDRLATVSLEQLARFLWNLAHISERQDLRILEHRVIKERLGKEAEMDIGACVEILGVLSLVRPEQMSAHPYVIDFYKVGGKLAQCLKQALKDRRSYRFALCLQGVWALDEEKAIILAGHILRQESSKHDCLSILKEALSEAVTPLSVGLLNTTILRIEQTVIT